MKKNIIFLAITIAFILSLYGCGRSNGSDIKTVRVSQFTDLIFEDTSFLPNNEFTWNMGKDDFLSMVYGADTMDPDSESFEEYRYFYSEETNITTFTPPMVYAVNDIPGEAEAAFAFNEGGLFKAGYVWTYKADEAEKAEKAVTILAQDFNTNENIVEGQPEIPDFSDEDSNPFPYRYQWPLVGGSQGYIELSVLKMQENIIVQLTVGI